MQIEVIPHKFWQHKEDSTRKASIYGALPPGGEDQWRIVTKGWTWRCTDRAGRVTVGMGRKPAATREEAEDVANIMLVK